MKRYQYLILIALLAGCKQKKNDANSLEEFQFPQRREINLDYGHLTAFTELDSLKVGDYYRAKVFLAHRHLVYDSDSIEPIIRYQYKDSIPWDSLYNHGTLAEVLNDTAYIKFPVSDGGFRRGSTDRQDWWATIQIPRPSGDTIFYLKHGIIIKK
ncbi:hypothetical protein GU926_17645 [Nibribacter ruber]|uniref:Uncharacterized protein n=1 Tax=Nibribacter ruber TaxID=2698458 RepID=A0A6P1P4A4_9BACT|nr:hypothetical protein [Nibribacter ruber]QHL89156.1 hypothetical protein GU926_17645 [Nibribacter ruber]